MEKDNYNKELPKHLSTQLNLELNSFYLYTAFYAYTDSKKVALKGLRRYFKEQYKDELKHAAGVIEYMNQRGLEINLEPLKLSFDYGSLGSALDLLKLSLENEKKENKNVHLIYKLSSDNNDYATCQFLDAYVGEQMRSIKELEDLIVNFERSDKHVGTMLFDQTLFRYKKYFSPDKVSQTNGPFPGSIENGALIHHDLHNALAAMKTEVAHQQQQQQQQQQTQLTNGTTASHSGSSGRSTPNNADPAPGKLFVGGLSWQTSSEKLQEYFGVFGTVTDVLIMKDPVTQRSRGFGFITFSEPSSVENVLKVPIHILDGKKIDPKHATPKNRPRQTHRTKKIFVGGVSQDISADEVKAYFNQFGKVEETVLLMDQQTKRHRGFGFVTFENEDVVDRVCEIHFHTIKNKKVECKKAQPKEAVTPAAQLLQKRLMLGGLGVRMVAPPTMTGPGSVQAATPLQVVQAQTQAQAAQAAAVMQAQNAAAAGYGKVFTTYPPTLHSFRYAPYPIPASAAAAAAHLSAAQHAQPHNSQPQQQQPTLQTAPTVGGQNPYHPQGYGLPNVDMSSFQGVDWSSMYGMGIY